LGIRILLVDDSSVMRKIILRSLRQAGIEVESAVEAADGDEALRLFQPAGVDLVICDLNMPRMGGDELARQLRLRDPNVPILLITAEAGRQKLGDALACGASDILRKPFLPDELRSRVLPLLGRSGPRAE